ncbi:restriction endonuclease [Methanobrevibacter millerae]|uniref:Restriction endonuclease n=1 Tax=Methanobrevibacter millerae TaxID=230361 RepID=A0A0U3CKE0_9EURY|nr:restriction endonuclease [Methanobrevibacter millerae]ALT68988.1 restriction endonuclease [Methanobrevibacter millerae]
MIPKFKEFYFPVLSFFKDNDIHTKKEVSNYIAKFFELNENDLNEKTSKGSKLKYEDRTQWAVNHLYRATLLKRIERGKYLISEEGKKVLNQEINQIDENFLNNYDSFKKYRNLEKNKDNMVGDNQNQSPSERLDVAYNEINEELSESILDEIKSKDSKFFEKLVVDLLLKMGYGGFRDDAGRPTQQSNDEGIDGIINEDILGLDKIAIQAKRHENSIGRPDLQRFAGALSGKGIKKGVFITTSYFSKNAKNYVKNHSERSIVLIDGKKLAKLMIEFNLGTSIVHSYDVKKIDMDYFNSED